MDYTVRNATIMSTRLGVRHTDHGILSFSIVLDYGGGGQGFGQIVLDTVGPNTAQDFKRIPSLLASGLLLAIDEVFGKDWEDLPKTPCRALQRHNNVKAIGHYLEDKWLWYDDKTNQFAVSPYAEIPQREG